LLAAALKRSSSEPTIASHLEDALLALVGRYQIRQHSPRRDEPEPLRRVRHHIGGGGKRDGRSRTCLTHPSNRLGAHHSVQGLSTVAPVGVKMDRLRSRRNSSLRLGGYLLRTIRGRGMHAVTVQSGLQQRWVSHRTILAR
jgi:hypothetical protein